MTSHSTFCYRSVLIITQIHATCFIFHIPLDFFFILGNTRVIGQTALQTFQDEMKKVKNDPYKVVMRQTKLPITLLNEVSKVRHLDLVYFNRYLTFLQSKVQRRKYLCNLPIITESSECKSINEGING